MRDEVYAVNPENAWRAVDGEVVIINSATTVYYSLNATGSQVWHLLLEGGASVDGMTQQLAAHYGEDAPAVRQQVEELISSLVEEQLISEDSSAHNNAPARPQTSSIEGVATGAYDQPVLNRYDSLEKLVICGE